jgi:hypothetical protein
MAVMVLGEHDGERLEEAPQPAWCPPTKVGRVAPPDVDLTDGQADQSAGPGDAPKQGSDDEVRYGTEEPVEQDGGIRREYGMIEERAATVVMRAQMQRKPEMLRHVVEERRREVAGNESYDESCNKKHSGGDLAGKLQPPYHIPHFPRS